MKKSELKGILKPLIKECIKEVIFEDGVLSGLISEVARGMNAAPVITAAPTIKEEDPTLERMKRNALKNQKSDKLNEHRKKLMSAIGGSAYNGVDLFEGTTPAPAETSPSQQAGALSGQEPGDPGVDIANLFGTVGNHWNAHMNEMKERE